MKKFYKAREDNDNIILRYAKNEEYMDRSYTEEISICNSYSSFFEHLQERIKQYNFQSKFEKPTYFWLSLCKALILEEE